MAVIASLPRLLRTTIVWIGAAAVIGIMFALAWQAAIPAQSGAADPLVGIRSPLVRAATWAGILAKPSFLGGSPWLPTHSSTTLTTDTSAEPEHVRWSIATTHTPVYRPIWKRVGERVAIQLGGSVLSDCERVRLVSGHGSERTVLDEMAVATGDAPLLLAGYVADSASAYSIEVLRQSGSAWEPWQSRGW